MKRGEFWLRWMGGIVTHLKDTPHEYRAYGFVYTSETGHAMFIPYHAIQCIEHTEGT